MRLINSTDNRSNYAENLIVYVEATPLLESKITPREACLAGVCCFTPNATDAELTRNCLCCITWTNIGLGAATATTYAVKSVAAPYLGGSLMITGLVWCCCFGGSVKC